MGERIGPYEVIRRLGQGGMATVEEVRHVETGGRYALKRLDPELNSEEGLRERFAREARALASLDHPNVVGVHGAELDGATPYFVQPLLTGGTLQDLVDAGPVSFPLARRLIGEVALGLAHAHERGVVHRDLKPENVLLDEAQHAQLADFGLAHVGTSATPLTKTGEILGTPAYMSPEQARDGSAVDERTDVYGLGAILYALLTGRPPFESKGRGVFALLSLIQQEPPISILVLRPDTPPALVRVCERALSKDAARRPSSARAFLAELEAAPASRLRTAAGLIGSLAGVLALGAWAIWPPAPEPRTLTDTAPVVYHAPPPPPPPPLERSTHWTGNLRLVPLLIDPSQDLFPCAAFTPDGILIYDGRGGLLRCPLEVRSTPETLERIGDAPTLRRPFSTLLHVHEGVRLIGLWPAEGAGSLHWASSRAQGIVEEIFAVSATSSGPLLGVADSRGAVRLFDVVNGVLRPQPKPLELPEAQEVAFKGDDAYGVGEGGTLGTQTGLIHHWVRHADGHWSEAGYRGQAGVAYRCLALDPGGERLVVGDNYGWLQDVETKSLTLGERWPGTPRVGATSPIRGSHPNGTLRDCAFVAQGRLLLSLAKAHRQQHESAPEVTITELRAWDPATHRESQEVIVLEGATQSRLAVSADGGWVLFSTRSQVYLVEVR